MKAKRKPRKYTRGHSPGYIEYKTCKRKLTYYTRHQAIKALQEIATRGGPQKNLYKCPYCHRYHLTKK